MAPSGVPDEAEEEELDDAVVWLLCRDMAGLLVMLPTEEESGLDFKASSKGFSAVRSEGEEDEDGVLRALVLLGLPKRSNKTRKERERDELMHSQTRDKPPFLACVCV